MTASDILSDIIVHNKYARHLGSRRENWMEIVMRSAAMHAKKFPDYEKEIYEAFSVYVGQKKVMPSMRSLHGAGKSIELSPNRLFNCAYTAIDDYRAFSEIMFLLLGGSGVGFSVQARHISQLPPIVQPRGSRRYVIQDNILGFSEAIRTLMKAYFFGRPKPRYIFSDIREKGSLIVTAGGKAPGPEPLKNCLFKLEGILSSKQVGERLKDIEVLDIVTHIAESVFSAGLRRSATICLFDPWSYDMLTAKSGNWSEENPHRGRANLSAVLDRRTTTQEEFERVFKMTQASGSGEPGFAWTNDPDMGLNPCAEISLPSNSMCNLTTLQITAETTQKDLNKLVEVGAFIGTLQATYTDFFYLRPEWKHNVERDALLGVSLTGLASLTDGVGGLDFSRAAKIVTETNAIWAEKLGINPAKRTTCIKPEGTTSLVLGTSSGIHTWHAPYYIRRMQLNKSEAIYQYLAKVLPELLEDKLDDPINLAFIKIPLKAPEGAITDGEEALDFLKRIKHFALTWIASGHIEGANKHNVSCTVSVNPEEWDLVKNWMWENRYHYTGISLYPKVGGTYTQLPMTAIDKSEYEALLPYLKNINLDDIEEFEDNTELSDVIACGGGGCELI